MSLNFDALAAVPRLLLEARLQPSQGTRFQPTGFPNLGAATYDGPKGEGMLLLVESNASLTNWLERTIFEEFTRDSVSDDLIPQLTGLPYVKIDCGSFGETSTLLESHRLNTPYLWENTQTDAIGLQAEILAAIGVNRRKKKGDTEANNDADEAAGRINMQRFYRALMKLDPNCLIHGVFLEKISGRLRVPRALSGFIEAANVTRVESGGTKFDHVFPAKDEKSGITSQLGFTNVPYPKTEFASPDITAYFQLDLAQIRGYRLGVAAEKLLTALAIYKVARLLESGWNLRSNCKFEVKSFSITRLIEHFVFPTKASEVAARFPDLIKNVVKEGLFDPDESERVRVVTWVKKAKAKKLVIEMPRQTTPPKIPENLNKTVKWKKESKKNPPKLELAESPDEAGLSGLLALFSSEPAKAAIRKSIVDIVEDEPDNDDDDAGEDGNIVE